MDIKAAILEEHSKAQAQKIANYIGRNKKRFEKLLDLFFGEDQRITQRAAYAVMHVVDNHPDIIQSYLSAILDNLQNPIHVAVKRNSLRILQNVDLPEDLLGLAADLCFGFLNDTKEAVAVRVFAMQVCYNICVREPELAPELKAIIEDFYPHGTAGFKSRGRKILKQLNGMIKE